LTQQWQEALRRGRKGRRKVSKNKQHTPEQRQGFDVDVEYLDIQ